jgi:hypothetical protein
MCVYVSACVRVVVCGFRVGVVVFVGVHLRVCVRGHPCFRASVCARSRVRVRVRVPVVRAFVCARVRVFVQFYWQAFARHWGSNLCVCPCACVVNCVSVYHEAVLALPWHGGDRRCLRARGRARVRLCVGAIGPFARVAAGVTWTSRTSYAPWAGQYGRMMHTSVIDAAGAIYVIGGQNGPDMNDVWASNDRGA